MFKGTMTKWPVQKLTQGSTQKLLQHHDATDMNGKAILTMTMTTEIKMIYILINK